MCFEVAANITGTEENAEEGRYRILTGYRIMDLCIRKVHGINPCEKQGVFVDGHGVQDDRIRFRDIIGKIIPANTLRDIPNGYHRLKGSETYATSVGEQLFSCVFNIY